MNAIHAHMDMHETIIFIHICMSPHIIIHIPTHVQLYITRLTLDVLHVPGTD